jgi:nicotinate-nucleotide pyrophosphorylase (carboxylating)
VAATPFDPVENALAEDVGSGDLTSQIFIPEGHRSTARIFAKERCVLAGTQAAVRTYQRIDPALEVDLLKND